jgi:hypothetical protein
MATANMIIGIDFHFEQVSVDENIDKAQFYYICNQYITNF